MARLVRNVRRSRGPTWAAALILLVAIPLLAACSVNLGGSQEVVVVTATSAPPVQQVIVTATSTQQAQQVVVTATSAQPMVVTATSEPATQQVLVVTATFTAAPPTETPDLVATQIAALQAAAATLTAQAPTATNTPEPTDTSTPAPPTNTPKPKPTNTPKPKPTNTPANLPPPVLLGPGADFNCFNAQGCLFTWSWGMALAANQYFQVQLVGPANEHRGIHPPTKGYMFQSDYNVYQIIRDWCDPSKMCHMQWTVAVIEWDGVDPSKIGRTLSEAKPPRWVWL